MCHNTRDRSTMCYNTRDHNTMCVSNTSNGHPNNGPSI